MRVFGLSRPALLALVAGGALAAGHLAWYAGTPSGRHPVLDGREMVNEAAAMAAGGLRAEPFYRAPLYAAGLSVPLGLGLDPRLLPDVARLVNLVALLATAWFAARLAERLWESPAAGAVAAALVAANPVLHYFSGDPFDIMVATALLAAAMLFVAGTGSAGPAAAGWAGALLGLGSLARTHLLLPALALPAWLGLREPRSGWRIAALAAAGPAAALLLTGAANLAIAGEFRVTPWQGAYNLWAGNGPGANGRYFTQSTRVEFGGRFDNPARLESVALYEAETGARPPHDIGKMNRHWVARTLRHVAGHPLDWLWLLARKSASLLHHHEQYDNKTYSFQKTLSPWLRWNPIGWGVLLALSVPGWLALRRRNAAAAKALLVLAGAYAAGVVLFHTNNRFRVPLVPALAVCAAGATAWWADPRHRLRSLAAAGAVAALALPPWPAVARDATVAQDLGLLALAAQEAGEDRDAQAWALRGLELSPGRDDLREIVLISGFNLMLVRDTPPGLREVEGQLEAIGRIGAPSGELRHVRAVYLWKLGRADDARAEWRALVEARPGSPPAAPLAMLVRAEPENPHWPALARRLPEGNRGPLLEAVLAPGDALPGETALVLERLLEPVKRP